MCLFGWRRAKEGRHRILTHTHHHHHNPQAHAPDYLQWLSELTAQAQQQQQQQQEGGGGGASIPFPPPPSREEEEGREVAAAEAPFTLAPGALVGARRAAGAVLHAVDQIVSGALLLLVVVVEL